MDFSRFIDPFFYTVILYIIDLLWTFNRVLMLAALQLGELRAWVFDNAGDLLELFANALYSPAAMAVIIAFGLYGLWRLVSAIMPDLPWRPVQLPKLVVYTVIIGAFFSAPAAVLVGVDTIRTEIALALQSEIIGSFVIELVPSGYSGTDTPVLPSAISSLPGSTGVNIAAGILRVNDVSELGSLDTPVAFQTEFTPIDQIEYEAQNADDRRDIRNVAQGGIVLYSVSWIVVIYAILELMLWFVLDIAVLALWIGLPVALIFAPFSETEGLFKSFFSRYVSVIVETLISVVIISIFSFVILFAGSQGTGLLIGMTLIGITVLIWRIASAFKIAGAAVNTIGGSNVTGGLSLGGGVSTVTTAAATGAGVALLGAAGVQAGGIAAGGMLKNMTGTGDGAPADYTAARRTAGAGGYFLGKNKALHNMIAEGEQMRILGGYHDPSEGMDGFDAVYLGSRLSGSPGSTTYLTTSMMGGPMAAYGRMGVGPGLTNEQSNTGNGNSRPGGQFSGMSEDGYPYQNPLTKKNDQEDDSDTNRGGHSASGTASSVSEKTDTQHGPEVSFQGESIENLNQYVDRVKPGIAGHQNRRVIQIAQNQYHPEAGNVAELVAKHGSGPVKEAMGAIKQVASDYQQQGLNSEQIAEKFSSGEAQTDASIVTEEGNDAVQSTSAFQTLSRFALRPVQAVSAPTIVQTIGSAVDQNVAPADVQVHFNKSLSTSGSLGPYTGTVRGIVENAQAIGANGAQLQQAYEQHAAGNTEAAVRTLAMAPSSNAKNIDAILKRFDAVPAEASISKELFK